jgi:glycosyltransferase involved in cell wall biosynthesis
MSVKLSIFTPTHNPKHLDECHESLQVQGYDNYEWVIIPNGDCPELPAIIRDDPHVRIVPGPESDKIGALKHFACDQCTGDAFIELDHDDLLVPDTLPKIAAAIEEGAGFVYSDVAVFNDGSLDSWAYHPSHGWESYDLRVYERPFRATRCFPIQPRSLCEVYYAPDHVRVWSREAYEKVGGHNVELGVGDDHELVCRTYIAGFPFAHIGGCGYLYRYHPKNTVKERNQEIQIQQRKNRHKYLDGLIKEWCKREGLQSVQLVHLVREGKWNPEQATADACTLPFEESSVGQVVAFDVLQYLPAEAQVAFFNEAYRVLAPGGYLNVGVPSPNGRYATQDPRHRSQFNENSFLYYTAKEFAGNNKAIQCRFQLTHYYEQYPNEHFEKYKMLMLHADLCALKGQRQPAPTYI